MSGFRNPHYPYMNEDGFDLDFIEAAHYDRERDYQIGSAGQRPLGGKTVIEVFAPKDVTVLALPTLYCMGCGTEHPCAYTHTLASDMGVCRIDYVKDPEKYVPSERVTIVAEQTYTGRIQRKQPVGKK